MLNKKFYQAQFFIYGTITGISVSFIYLIPFFFIGYYFFLKRTLSEKSVLTNFFSGWFFGFGFFLGSMHWIISPFMIYEKHLILAPFVLAIFPLFLGLFFSIPSVCITKFEKKFSIQNSDFFFFKSFAISIFFFFSEYLRSIFFGGLPFNLSAHIWAFNDNFLRIASYVGVYGLTFLTIFWVIITNLVAIKKKKSFLFFLIFFPCFLFSFSFLSKKETSGEREKILVRIVQPNIPQKEKWNRLLFQEHLEKMLRLSLSNVGNERLIVVWPEAALTVFLNEEDNLVEFLDKNLKENVTLITGGLRRSFSENNFKVFNSLYVFGKHGLLFYDKRKLVPFGEFMPLKSIFNILKLTQGETDFTIGKRARLINLRSDNVELNFEPSICYEAIFQTFNYKEVEVLINITNDAWFGKTTGPRQHLAASIFRSVEKGVPLVRVANSGISVLTDKNGKIISKLGLNESGFLEHEIELGENATIFMKYRNKILLYITFIIGLIVFLIDSLQKIKKRKSLKINRF